MGEVVLPKFSERYGYVQSRQALTDNQVPESLRKGLWNSVHLSVMSQYMDRFGGMDEQLDDFMLVLWVDFLNQPVDARPMSLEAAVGAVRRLVFDLPFPELYDLIEFIARLPAGSSKFVNHCNHVLEKERAAFRFVGGRLVKMIHPVEIEEVEAACSDSNAPGIRKHISRALKMYSDRSDPDFRNSIKESISAVEASARIITGDPSASLGKALNEIEKNSSIASSFTRRLQENLRICKRCRRNKACINGGCARGDRGRCAIYARCMQCFCQLSAFIESG